ncbi:MAG: MarR family transcriptional regulator [Myxococcales bacterium]|nr:MarR family transcriptional regulator [Myxococcales bacterium]
MPAPPIHVDADFDPEQAVVEGVGRLMEFWGFRRHLGRLWTVLYLSPEPLASTDIGDRLQLSPSAVSLTIGELMQWGAVKKTKVPGDRRDFYTAETSIWRLVTRVVRQRELALVRDTAELLERASGALAEARRTGRLGAAEARFMERRIGRLRLLSSVGEKLLGAFVSGMPLDPNEVRAVGGREDAEDARGAHDGA